MPILPSLRKRVPSQAVAVSATGVNQGYETVLPGVQKPTVSRISGAASRLMAGLFGTARPQDNESAQVTQQRGSLYNYHEGDLFTPGAPGYAFDMAFELPLQTVWGNGFLRVPNTFVPLQGPQVYQNQGAFTNGLGGLQAGAIVLQPLESDGD